MIVQSMIIKHCIVRKINRKSVSLKKLIFSPFYIFCILCTLWCVGLLVLYMASHQKLFSLLELFFTADGHIANKSNAFLKVLLAPVTLFILFLELIA